MPSLPPPVWVELSYDGAFNDITDDLLTQDPVTVTRGRSSERDSAGPSQGQLSLLNTDAKYSRRNPNSELFEKVGISTPIRYGYDQVGSVWAVATGATTSYLSTPSSSAFDISGDLDVRAEIAPEDWQASLMNIAARYDTTTNNRGWLLHNTGGGVPELFWSTDGTATQFAAATAYMPTHAGQRMALRATLDVANADGVWEVRFYTALSVDAPEDEWRMLGSPVFGGASTSVFDPPRPVEFGARSTNVSQGVEGRLYRLQLRGGIGGTVLLDVDTSLADEGDTSFQDANGITWTANQITFTRRHTRFRAEVPDWTPQRDKSGNFKTVSIAPAGISRRLSAGEELLRSPLFREMTNPGRQNIVGYWPLEDSSDALSLASGLVSGRAGSFAGDVSLAADSTTWLSSQALPTFKTGTMSLPVLAYTDTGEMSLRYLLAAPSGGVSANGVMARLTTTGIARRWDLFLHTNGNIRVVGYDVDGSALVDNTIAFAVNGQTVAVTFEVSVSAGTITWKVIVASFTPGLTVDDPVSSSSLSGTFSGTAVGRVTSLRLGDGTVDLAGTVIGHPAIANALAAYANTADATIGWNGETARNRLLRLGAEENVALSVAMPSFTEPRMGVQQSSTFLDLLRDVEKVDQGLLFERRDGTELVYRGAATLVNQAPVLTLDFSAGLLDDIRPKDDDRAAFNVMTAKRISGSEFTYELAEGANSTQDPPDGIGYKRTSVELPVARDDDLPDQAAWRVHVATVDEMRYPVITLNLANERVFALIDDILRVDVGDKIRLTGLPPDYSVDDVDLLVWGGSDAAGPDAWPVSFVCVPAEPWNVGVVGSSTYGRADTAGSQTAAALTTSQTTVNVLTTARMRWIWTAAFGAMFPFDVRAGGEVWRVTACTGAVEDSFTRSVSNGWGTATVGGAWTNTGGAASDYAVTGSVGTHSLTSVNASRHTVIPAPYPDVDLTVDVATSALALGNPQYAGLLARYTDVNNLYYARAAFNTNQTITLVLQKRVGGTQTDLASVTVPATHVAAAYYRMRFQVTGSTLRAKLWDATGSEPLAWQASVTDTSLTAAGSVGARSILGATNTNTLPVTVSYDNLAMLNPQQFTVTRSVNDVVKAHAAGTAVRLARPVYLALKEA